VRIRGVIPASSPHNAPNAGRNPSHIASPTSGGCGRNTSLEFELVTSVPVVSVLDRITRERGFPQRIQVDQGPEFISKDLDRWEYWNGVQLDFSRPGKPTDNTLVEAFISRFRQECLNQHWFMSLPDAREKIEVWRREYNRSRPHGSLGYRSPVEFAESAAARQEELY
jgi:putative transposase